MSKVEKVVTKSWEAVLPETSDYQGLCLTCVHAPGCAYRQNAAQIILECNEFDDRTAGDLRLAQDATSAPKTVRFQSDFEASNSGKFMGLCVNCDYRENCKLPKTDGGIWHCEEYR